MLSLSTRPATPADLPALQRLLAELGLPLAGVEHWLAGFLVVEASGEMVAVAGLEIYQRAALLRSVGVRPLLRKHGVAQSLVGQLLGAAQRSGCDSVYLLTTTAESYFSRLGFAVVDRAEVPAPVTQSVEFREACPASATVMMRRLNPDS